LCEVLEGRSETSFIAVFDARRVEDGPVAKVRLHRPSTDEIPSVVAGWVMDQFEVWCGCLRD
jgi:carotenoid cleavage dioxygenase-like enzyme